MNKIFNCVLSCFLFTTATVAQSKFFTKAGVISFNSKTSIEKIEATNKKVLAVFDLANNKIEFSVLIKGFEFEKALMQEHFNENYLESDKHPKATFKGKFDEDKLNISLNENKTHTLNVSGNLTLHGVTKAISSTAILIVKNGVISATSSFTILLADYKIKIPAINKNNVNNSIQVSINLANLQEMK
jgi:hypothetical protein